MNIATAKEQIKNAVKIYLQKNEDGTYQIPVVHQRPVFVMGPPGLGKTAIMQQIAEYDINDGALSVAELNEIDTDLWRKGVTGFGRGLGDEMQAMARILLKSA